MYKMGDKVRVYDKTKGLPKNESEVWKTIQKQGGLGYVRDTYSDGTIDIGFAERGLNATFSVKDIAPWNDVIESSTEL